LEVDNALSSEPKTLYVASKPPKGGSKTRNGHFPSKIALYVKKVCYKVSLCENCLIWYVRRLRLRGTPQFSDLIWGLLMGQGHRGQLPLPSPVAPPMTHGCCRRLI